MTADPVLVDLPAELDSFAPPMRKSGAAPAELSCGVVVPLQLQTSAGVLSFFSTTMVFGTSLDITLSELAVKSFFPADAETVAIVRRVTMAG